MRNVLKLLAVGTVVVLVAVVGFSFSAKHVPSVSAAAVDFFLKLENAAGEATNIELESWSWGVTSPRDAASGLPTGRRQYQPIIIRKRIDKSSPLLARTSDAGTQIKKLTLTGQTASKQKYQISFFDVFIEEYMNSDDQGSVPMEEVSFNYQRIEFEY